MSETLVHHQDTERSLPDTFHSRTGHHLPQEASRVQNQLLNIQEHAQVNQMMINAKKTKLMLFNQCNSIDFMPHIELEGQEIELVEEMKLLGVIIQSDLKWSANTEYIVSKAFKQLWVLRRLKQAGANQQELIDMYIKIVRCHSELAVPVWHSSLTNRGMTSKGSKSVPLG